MQLARLGAGAVAPNPMVGAVLVYNDRIIGEGWHEQYGQPHAEVNCLRSVREEDRTLIRQSTLYVSLEPCAHFGKTPPCADLIIREQIPVVVIGCRDSFPAVDGKGIEKLQGAGVKVIMAEAGMANACRQLNQRFSTFHEKHRPYIVLKWAQTADLYIGSHPTEDRLYISNEYTNRLAHRWRAEEAAILVGTNTALQDNPSLTNRLWAGPSPVRLLVDRSLRLPSSLRLFDRKSTTVVFNDIREERSGNLVYYKLKKDADLIPQLLNALVQLNIQSVLVEGGATLLQSFIDAAAWDEARIITNKKLTAGGGIAAPKLSQGELFDSLGLEDDEICFYKNQGTATNQ